VNNQQQTTLLLVRHADVHNPNKILYGRLPRFKLSELGLRQAEVTAQALAEEPITTLYSSPMLRARQTARILATPHPEATLRITYLLDEVLTAWQGRLHSELHAHGFNFYANRLHPTDETIEQVWARVERFIRQARKKHPGETIVGVSHGDPIILTRAYYSGSPLTPETVRLPSIYPGNGVYPGTGSITRLTFSPGLQETYPVSLEYYDPNSQDKPWSHGWVKWTSRQPTPVE
jgi:broad specificity phosphatase PhoE